MRLSGPSPAHNRSISIPDLHHRATLRMLSRFRRARSTDVRFIDFDNARELAGDWFTPQRPANTVRHHHAERYDPFGLPVFGLTPHTSRQSW
jgi:hypothetical protein